ncbi:MAG: 50S ribosomal protein L9 [Mogibacterium sp.]|nr:50S ribosomal protein L9 [Mogibacterium sp.]
MEVILKRDVKGTGKAGDIVKVSDGFARNRLIPSGDAVEATEANKKMVARQNAKREEQLAKDKADAEELAKKLSKEQIVIKTKTGDGGRLFGSITSMDIAEAIKEQTGEEIDKRKVVLDKPIKETGVFEIDVKLFSDVSAKIEVKVEGGKED